MRLDILNRGYGPGTRLLFALIRLFSGHPVPDAVKLVFYRPDFHGRPHWLCGIGPTLAACGWLWSATTANPRLRPGLEGVALHPQLTGPPAGDRDWPPRSEIACWCSRRPGRQAMAGSGVVHAGGVRV